MQNLGFELLLVQHTRIHFLYQPNISINACNVVFKHITIIGHQCRYQNSWSGRHQNKIL